jgi:hypothetical protein
MTKIIRRRNSDSDDYFIWSEDQYSQHIECWGNLPKGSQVVNSIPETAKLMDDCWFRDED